MRYKLRQTGAEVQGAIDKIIDLQEATPSKAGLLSASDKSKLDNVFNSPELTGTPTAPTAPQGTSTTQIATTEYVQNEVSQMHQFSYQVVDQLPIASADTMYIIYFVPSSNPKLTNVKDEYITVRTDDGGSITYSWEQIGSTSVDMSAYVRGPQSASNLHVAVFDGATGKLVKDGGATVEELKVTNRAFPVGWRTSGTMAQLILDINSDATAVKGKSYLSTVSYSDLPAGLMQAEMVVEIMDELAGLGKVILFTVTSSDTAPYHWEYTSAYGATGTWRGLAPVESPAFSGTPTAPTANVGTNTQQLATTEFVHNEIVSIPTATQSTSGYMSAADKTKLDGLNVKRGTTAYWNSQIGFIPADGEIIIYTDYQTITKISPVTGEEITMPVPGIKIGTGNAYVQDLAFVDEWERDLIYDHIHNTDVHVSPEDKQRWNNKLNCENQITGETLILNRL